MSISWATSGSIGQDDYRKLATERRRRPPERAAAGARFTASVPLTRSREARKGRAVQNQPERVVLDRDDLRRTLVRIAHEIVEKNPAEDAGTLALVGIHTRGAVLARRLHALVGELTGSEVPLGDLDISFYRDDLDDREPGRPAGRPQLASRLRPRRRGPWSSSTTSSTPAARCGRRSTPCSTTAVPTASSSRCSPTAGTASFRSGPTTSARTCRRARDERVFVRVEETDGVDEVSIGQIQPATATVGRSDEASALDRGSRPRGHRADHGAGGELRRGRPPRHQEGPDPARADDRQPLLRVEHPDQLLVRARREAALGRRRLGQVRRARRSTRASRSRTRSRPCPPTRPEAIIIRSPARRRREAGDRVDRRPR